MTDIFTQTCCIRLVLILHRRFYRRSPNDEPYGEGPKALSSPDDGSDCKTTEPAAYDTFSDDSGTPNYEETNTNWVSSLPRISENLVKDYPSPSKREHLLALPFDRRRRNTTPELTGLRQFRSRQSIEAGIGISSGSKTKLSYTMSTPASAPAAGKPNAPDIVTGVGRLQVLLDFTEHTSKLGITISNIDFPPYQERNLNLLEISVMLLPGKRQSFKAKPKSFNDPVFIYLIPKEKIAEMSLRFRLYEHEKMGTRHLLGEGNFKLGSVNLNVETIPIVIDLHAPGIYSPSVLPEGPLTSDRPEILISLEYRHLTGRMLLEILKTRNMGIITESKTKNLMVKVKLVTTEGKLIYNAKTTIRRYMIDPEYNEMFIFNVSESSLTQVTLLITLVSVGKNLSRKIPIGQVALGQNYSDQEERNHWIEMMRFREKAIVRWHKFYSPN